MWSTMPVKYKKLLRLILVVTVVYLGFRYLLPLFLPFLLAVVVARCLRRPVRFLWRRLRVKPVVSGSILILLFLGVIGGGIAYLVRLLLSQFALLVENYEGYKQEWQGYFEGVCVYCDEFFRVEKGRTFSLLNDGYIGALGTDCHNLTSRPPDYTSGYERILRSCSEEAVQHVSDQMKKLLHIE